MTRSKGPTEELSLPPTRMRKDVSTANEEEKYTQGQVQANVASQQRTVDMQSPFARPGSWAGTCTTPASEGGVLPTASNPFARPNSRASFAQPEPTSPQSSVSSSSDNQLQEDVNTSVSWDLVDTDTDAEVANINASLPHKTVTDQHSTGSTNTTRNNAVDLRNEINTLYNQDFFVADTTGRRLSQVADKSNYSSLLPNGNAAIRLRLPDLLIYLKTDTYLVDVKTGHHYAVYHNRIEKMSVLPKLYSAWPYRQLLQAIHDDAVRFGVNSPELAASKQSAPVQQPSPKVHTPSPRIQELTIPPTPYVNQAAVEQHKRTQSPSVPPRNIATITPPPRESQQANVVQETLITLATSQTSSPQAQNDLTTSPQRPKKSKSKDGRGIKQSKNVNATDIAQVCWRCGELGHKKRDCRKPPFCGKCRKEGHVPALCPMNTGPTLPSPQQQQADKFSNPTNQCVHCGGYHVPGSCPVRYQPKATSSTTHYSPPPQRTGNNDVASGQVRGQVTPQVSPLAQVNTLAQPTRSNSFPPPPYFPIPFPPPPVPPSNASIAPSAPASDLSAAISLMTNAVNQGNASTTNITNALQRTTTQFADALQKTIQRGVEAQAEENRNARLDKQFDKIKIFDGSNPAECHPWLEEVHALCSQTGRPFKEMLLLCAGQAVRDFILDMAPDATDEQIKNDLITGYSDLQGLGCKQAAYDNITQRPDEPVRSYIVRYSRLFKLLNGTAPNEVRMRTTSMHFVNSLRGYLSSKVENRLLGMNERNYSLGDTFTVALQCELKAIASERRHNKRNAITINNVHTEDQDYHQLEDTQEVHVRNPNYKGKNYDPNYQARKAEGKQHPQLATSNNPYKAPAARPAATHNNDLARSSDIAGEVTLKTTVDGYQLLKMNELIKNAAAWRARMPRTNRFDKYFDKETTKTTPKVQINSATLQVMGQTAKDCGYTKEEFIEAVEMYEHFGNIDLEDVPTPSPQD